MRNEALKFYFSFRSPYSWIAARRLQRALVLKDTAIELIPFWEPDDCTLGKLEKKGGEFLYQVMSRAKHLYILQDIKRMTTKLGYKLAWPVDTECPWWDLPHLAYLSACQHGKGSAFFWAVFRWRWELGKNICLEPTIREIAEEVRLDPDETVQAPNDDQLREEGAEALYKCYRDDVFGVPFFMNGYQKFWGVDRLDDFLDSMACSAEKR